MKGNKTMKTTNQTKRLRELEADLRETKDVLAALIEHLMELGVLKDPNEVKVYTRN